MHFKIRVYAWIDDEFVLYAWIDGELDGITVCYAILTEATFFIRYRLDHVWYISHMIQTVSCSDYVKF
jgi:hypothetical protein